MRIYSKIGSEDGVKNSVYIISVAVAMISSAGAIAAPLRQSPMEIIERAISAGEKCITIPKSVYALEPGDVASIHLRNVKGVTIDFQGSELQGKVRSGMIRLDGCEDVTIKNAVIDYPHRLPFTQGVIRNVGPDGEWDVEIAEGYEDCAGGWPIQAYDGKTGDLVNPMRLGGEKLKRTGVRRYQITGGKNRKGNVGDVAVWTLRCDTYSNTQSISNRAHAVYLVGCKKCRIEDLTIYSTPGSNAFREILGDGGNTYLRCKVIPRDPKDDPVKRALPRYRSGSHDAFNSRCMKVGPTLIDCVARNHCDDDVNIHAPYCFVASAEGRAARVFVKDMYAGTLKVGDPVQFVTKDGYVSPTQPIVEVICPAKPTESELAAVKEGLVPQIAQNCNTMVEVTFDRDCDALKAGSLFASQNQNGNGFLIKGCRFGPNRARGFICNASNGTVSDCVFDRLESYGVLSRPSYQWLEGGASRNVRFKDCTFIDCGVFFGVHKEMETTPDCHRNIVFAGCKFKGKKATLDVRCCRGFAIDDNEFDVPAEKAISLTHVDNALIRRLDYGEHPKQHMMFMRPEGAKGILPVKVVIHGGGWTSGYAVDHGIYPILDSVANGSAAVAAVQYRFVGETKEMGVCPPVKGVYDDCCDAIRYLKSHASELCIDPQRISLYGGSAGGCVMLMMALKDSNPLGLYEIHPKIAQTTLDPVEVDAILPGFCYGNHAFGVSREDFVRRRDELFPMIREWSPLALLEKADPKKLPPIYLVYSHRYPSGRVPAGSADDRVHDAAYGDLFLEACRKRGVNCTLQCGSSALTSGKSAKSLKMGTPFSNGAVLQRGMEVPVWGTAEPGSTVSVEFGGACISAVVNADGAWAVKLPPMEASAESRTMTVREKRKGMPFGDITECVRIEDIVVGEVWFASGQSNMECPIWGTATRYRDAKGGIMTIMTRLPSVRYVKCRRAWSVERKELAAEWRKFMPEDLGDFEHIETSCGNGDTGVSLSAVAFYYARELYLALGVPIGIVEASYGGSNIDAWTPRSGYERCDESIYDMAGYPVADKWEESKKKAPVVSAHRQPTVLYNGMVASFAPMAMRGLIWYQGCSNGGEAQLYCAKLHALYEGWRREFANQNLRFYLVQLAPYNQNWLGICMAQTQFCAEEKNAAIAVTADVGNFFDIHPNEKEIVAQRLVIHALKRDYGFTIPEDNSPVLKSAEIKDGRARLVFDNVKDWYVYASDRSRNPAFELAGTDGRWYPADVVNYRKRKDKEGHDVETDYIDGPEIVLSCARVDVPAKARYMGKPRAAGTLYNEVSLPLGPFETSLR